MEILNSKKLELETTLQRVWMQRSKSEEVKNLDPQVSKIFDQVKKSGDKALFKLTEKFDGVKLKSLKVESNEIKRAYGMVDKTTIRALKKAKANIEKFHKTTIRKKERVVETEKGVEVWREFRPIEKVGLYVPGGKAAYPSTVLMLGVPAKLAGCKEVVMCTPCSKEGLCNPCVLVAADLCGIKNIFKVGGAQAIAAMAFGTKSIPKVYKIFGPGNQYVTAAKMMAYGEVDIDMPAGPSEVAVIADETANPKYVAADLLSQLEHGEDSQAVLITFSTDFAKKVIKEMELQMRKLSRLKIIRKSFEHSFAVVVNSIDEACEIANEYAPEHLEIITKKPEALWTKINNAGSVFLGQYSCEPLGDYATGSNHTLPTSAFSKMFSGLSASSFGKMVQVQKVSRRGIGNLRKTVEVLATKEGLDAHKNAVSIRFNYSNKFL